MKQWNDLEHFLKDQREGNTEGCRKIFHGPGGHFPGLEFLIIDQMASLIFVVTYESFSSKELSDLIMVLRRQFPDHFIRVQERENGSFNDVYMSENIPDQIVVKEGDSSFLIHPGRGQNIGFFPDMENGRECIRSYLSGLQESPSVLNLFAYTCAFSVVSFKAGSLRVDNWDMNRTSLRIGRLNHELNGFRDKDKRIRYYAHDIFKSFGKLRKNGPYDLVIMDPPPFQGKSFTYKRDYPKLIRRVGEWLKEGGAGFFCLNASDCGWTEFKEMISKSLPGKFNTWEEVHPPENFTGRYPDRGLKCYLLTGWEIEKRPLSPA